MDEFKRLDTGQRAAVEQAIAAAREQGGRQAVELPGGAEAYAYRMARGRIAWGVNGGEHGFNIARGVREPDRERG